MRINKRKIYAKEMKYFCKEKFKITLYPVSSPFIMFVGGGDHLTYAAVLLITPVRTSIGGEDGGPSNVLPSI